MSHISTHGCDGLPSQVGFVEFICPGHGVVEQLAREIGAAPVVELEDEAVVEQVREEDAGGLNDFHEISVSQIGVYVCTVPVSGVYGCLWDPR